MSVTSLMTMVYGNLSDWRQGKNKANLAGTQMNVKPVPTSNYSDFCRFETAKKQSQFKDMGNPSFVFQSHEKEEKCNKKARIAS